MSYIPPYEPNYAPAVTAGVLQEWGPPESEQAAVSASVYGQRTLQGLTSLQMAFDSDALAIAQNYGEWFNFPIERVTQITLQSYSSAGNNLSPMLARGLYDRITVRYLGQTQGPAFEQDSLIEQITHTVNMDDPSWDTTWALSPYEILMEPTVLGIWEFGSPASVGVLTL